MINETRVKFIAAVIAVIMTSVLTACSKSEDSSKTSNGSSSVTQTEYVMQEGDTQVTGEVSEIVGNEVTLELGEVSQSGGGSHEMPADGSSADEAGEETGGSEVSGSDGGEKHAKGNGEMPEMADGSRPEMPDGEQPQIKDGETPPSMGDGEAPQMKDGEMPQMDEGQGGEKKSSSSIEKSGETATYIIPAGMQVSGSSSKTSDYSCITAGTILRLTLNSDGDVVAAEIL
jgi:hypothetical protein